MNNLNLNCEVGDVAVFLYGINSEFDFFRIGEEVKIVEVVDGKSYMVRRSYSTNYFYVDKAMLMKKEHWQMMKKAILADAIRMLSE